MPQLDRSARLDLAQLAEALDRKLEHDGLSLRSAAAELDLSPSTLTRLRQGHRPDAEAAVVLMQWLALSPDDVLVAEGTRRAAHRPRRGR